MDNRVKRSEVFLASAVIASLRSTCAKTQVGCVIVRDRRIVCTGYNGAPSGMPHCTDVGYKTGENGSCKVCIHAEAGAISFAARKGIELQGGILYTTVAPCIECAKLIINTGILGVHYLYPYRDVSGVELLKGFGVNVIEGVMTDRGSELIGCLEKFIGDTKQEVPQV